jgi:alanine dehydrogenase
MDHSVLLLSSADVIRLYPIEEAVRVIEKAFREYALGKSRMPSKVYLDLPEFNGDFRAMPACVFPSRLAGVKWVNSHPENRKRGLPSVMAMMIVNDVKTALPLAVMDATSLTNIRTGAAGAVAVKHLASKSADTIALIGTGAQARHQILAILSLKRKIREIRYYDPSGESMESFRRFIETTFPNKITAAKDVKSCVEDAGIVITTTPSRKPIVKSEWIRSGTHINAIGADAPGKQELDPKLLKRAAVIVDDIEQASHSGEINVPIQKRQYSVREIRSTIGEVVANRMGSRLSEETTIFDSTGLAIQDVSSAAYILLKASREPGLARFSFF